MLSEILNISGKPGLYLLLTGGKGSLIVESLDAEKKRLPIHRTDKVVSLVKKYLNVEPFVVKDSNNKDRAIIINRL